MFSTIAGLPMHPLVVHLAVVALPLAALGLIGVVFLRRFRPAYSLLTVIGLGVGLVAAFVAKESGESLAQRVGDPGDHAEYGDWLVPIAFVTFVLAALWWWLQRRDAAVDVGSRAEAPSRAGARSVMVAETTATKVLGWAAAAASVATIAMTVLVGHSGAKVVWSGLDASKSSATSTSNSTAAATGYTLAQVAKHASSSDCWAAIDGGVYNLTTWVAKHPGGAEKITAICGKDGSSAFDGQHGSDNRAKTQLASFKVGTLSK